MIDWVKSFFKSEPKLPTLRDRYWEMQPSLVKNNVGEYSELSLGWIASSLYEPRVSIYHSFDYPQRLGSGDEGWYRHQLVIL